VRAIYGTFHAVTTVRGTMEQLGAWTLSDLGNLFRLQSAWLSYRMTMVGRASFV
jgi:hypothetical protein